MLSFMSAMLHYALRTLSFQQSFARDCWRKQVPLVGGRLLSAFQHVENRNLNFAS